MVAGIVRAQGDAARGEAGRDVSGRRRPAAGGAVRPSTRAGGLAVWSTRARGTATRAACWCRGVCVDARRRSGAGRAHASGRCGAGAQACGRGAAWPSRLGTPSAVCAGGAARPGRRAFTRPSGCCVPGWGAWPCAGNARVSQTGHGARAGSAWHGCSAARGKRRGGPGRRWSGRAGSEREEGGARSTGAERAERRGVARSGRAAEEEGSECASAAKAECAGQGRHARPGARARGAVARAAGANCGRRSRDETVAREKRERARYDRRKRKGDIDEWNRESGIGCLGQRKDF